MRALLVIDMLKDFIEPDGKLTCGPAGAGIVPSVKALLDEFRAKDEPVLFIADRHLPADKEFDMFPEHCLQGSPGGEIIEPLTPREGERIIFKRRYSAFFGTDLDLTLRELGVTELVLVGVCTNICILYTAADARMRGYHVIVFPEAVASFDSKAHTFALGQMKDVLHVEVKAGHLGAG
ncbi:MAG: isochorismatase family cysteine hydrolase [Limnochordia bacterium]|jgi:nicotinamidase/pyrazinamidase|nr:cysteine hydrolase [Bacillota bacterium]